MAVVRRRALALLVMAAMAVFYLVISARGHRFAILTVRELDSEIWTAAWIWLGIPCGVVGAVIGGLRGDVGLSRTLERALIGALIASGVSGVLALAPELGVEVLIVVVVAGLPVIGGMVGWIAGGSHSHPNVALLASVVGVIVFTAGVSTFSTVQYILPVGLFVGGCVWILRSSGVLPRRKGKTA